MNGILRPRGPLPASSVRGARERVAGRADLPVLRFGAPELILEVALDMHSVQIAEIMKHAEPVADECATSFAPRLLYPKAG